MDARGNLRGAGLMMLSMAAFTFNDACIKLLAGDIPLMQVIFLRGVMASVLIWGFGRATGAIRLDLPRRDWALLALRSAVELGATFCFLTALFHMPIADVTAILQALPLTITLAAAFFLGEPVGWRRLLAIGAGFGGVLLIVRPGMSGFTVYALYAVAAVGFVTVRDLASRRFSPAVPSITVALVTAVAIAPAGGFVSLFEGWVRPTSPQLGLLGAAAVFILCGYVFSVAVMRLGEVAFVAPFRYTGLIWALLLGLVLFAEWPDRLTLLGAGIVVATGLFTLYRDAQARRKRARI